jgi:hypothetical protein
MDFSRIAGNLRGALNDNLTEKFSAANNWWGCNAGPGNSGCDSTEGNIDSEPRVVLQTVASAIAPGGTSNITADMFHNSIGENTSAIAALPHISVMFSSSQGSITPVISTMMNSRAYSVFTSTSLANGEACSTVDNQQACTPITNIGPTRIRIRNPSTGTARQ